MPPSVWWLTLTMGKREQLRDDLQRREAEVTAREAALKDRTEAAEAILAAADERDSVTDARDAAADKRENDLDRAEFLAPPDKSGYAGNWPERRNAALDRAHSRADRTASHDDRDALTEGNAEPETDET
jgi:multidrug efflux pump subunit AcrA (membrane-fusion protein)